MRESKNISKNTIRKRLIDLLRNEHVFWSYDENSVCDDTISDDQLIALTMRYLDLDEIALLFQLYSQKKIKSAWKRILVPEGDYLYTLNRFLAWYYFCSKNPDSYLKSLETRRLNQISSL